MKHILLLTATGLDRLVRKRTLNIECTFTLKRVRNMIKTYSQILLLFLMKSAYICLTHFLINLKLLLKYLKINARLAETNTTKEFIATLLVSQKFMIFLFYHLRSFLCFYSSFRTEQSSSISMLVILVLSPWVTFSLLLFLVTLCSYKLTSFKLSVIFETSKAKTTSFLFFNERC